jgi:hypothetical protein
VLPCFAVREVLRGLPFLHHVPQYIFDWLLDCGQLLGAEADRASS